MIGKDQLQQVSVGRVILLSLSLCGKASVLWEQDMEPSVPWGSGDVLGSWRAVRLFKENLFHWTNSLLENMDVESLFPEGVNMCKYCADLLKNLYFHQVPSIFKYCFSSVILSCVFMPFFLSTEWQFTMRVTGSLLFVTGVLMSFLYTVWQLTSYCTS